MEAYLKEKYGQEFVVKNYRIEGAGLGVEGDPTADAYAKDNKELRFKIWDTGSYTHGDHFYEDDYLRILWSHEGRTDVERFLKTNMIPYDTYNLEVSTIENSILNTKKGNVLHLTEALRLYRDELRYALSVMSTKTVHDEPSQDSVDTAFKILNFVKNKQIKDSRVYYIYRSPEFDRKDVSGSPLYEYTISAENDSIQTTISTSDLTKLFKKLN